MTFSRTSWMSAGYIAQAKKFLERVRDDELGEYTKRQKEGAIEGIACLDGAKPEYLTNIIKMDHPDRNMAVYLLCGEV